MKKEVLKMTEAWMVREIERRKLLEKLMSMVYRLEEATDKPMGLEIGSVIIEYLKSRRGESFVITAAKHDEHAFGVFFNNILPAVKHFARAEEEGDFLLVELLSKLIKHDTTVIHSGLLRLEIYNPQLIFGADSAMTRQKLPDED